MQDPIIPSPQPTSSDSNDRSREHRHVGTQGRRRGGFVTGLLFGALAAGLVGFAVGATMPAAEAALGLMAHGMAKNGGFGSDHDGPPTPEETKEHAEFFIGFALHRLDATDEQEQRVQGIVDGAIDQLYPVVQEHRANRDEFRSILSGPTIDRTAIEKLRVAELALADTLSRTIASALADSAEVLTVEQRTELVERLERFHHRH